MLNISRQRNGDINQMTENDCDNEEKDIILNGIPIKAQFVQNVVTQYIYSGKELQTYFDKKKYNVI